MKKPFILQKNQKMSTQFAWITTVLIAIISLLMAISILSFFNFIIKDISYRSHQMDFRVAAKIFDKIKVSFDENKPKNLDSKIESVLKDGIIAYVIIKDRHTQKILYSIDGRRKYNIERKPQDYAPHYITSKYSFIIGFYEKQLIKNYIKDFLSKLSILTTACIFFGLLMSYFMFKIISKPLIELTEAAEKYRQGNFSVHLEKTNYEEINTLIETYNSMGESLNELYTSLEMKVEERTVELEKAYKELQNTQAMMVHSEKMRSLGELVAGITHEINNPVNFIYGNLFHLQNYSNDLTSLISDITDATQNAPEEIKKKIDNLKKQYDYEFIKEDLPALIKSCQDGTERTKNIIMDLKNFSRMGEKITSTVDLASEIDTTLNILHNKIKNRITIHKDYAPDLPKIDALGGQLNQVFMNILDNAAYAIKETGNIKITMRNDEKYVTIEIEDDGCGMNKETTDKIFDPFFTTKPVGEGTGLGMSISYKVIKNHNGNIKVESEEGKGTKFTIKLPIENKNIIQGA